MRAPLAPGGARNEDIYTRVDIKAAGPVFGGLSRFSVSRLGRALAGPLPSGLFSSSTPEGADYLSERARVPLSLSLF